MVERARHSPPRQFLAESEDSSFLPSKRKYVLITYYRDLFVPFFHRTIPTAKAHYLLQNPDDEESQCVTSFSMLIVAQDTSGLQKISWVSAKKLN
jgi:hypothetical protein